MALADAMQQLPSLGWVRAPSPLTHLAGLAAHLGLTGLEVKRDDLLDALHGGNKARKLDVLLATAPFKDAPRFASLGAIGSGHLAACTAAAQALGKRLDAHLFFEELSQGVLENLAFVASGPTTLIEYRSRLEVGLRKPALVASATVDGVPMIPPGGTLPAGVAGVARAGFELAEQIRTGAAEAPDVVYCALGTGGTVAGLALGLGLAGVRTEVRAVATVERIFISAGKVRRLIAQTCDWLRAHGVDARPGQAVPVRVVRNQLGKGYGLATAQSLAAVEVLRSEGVPLEPIYTGKAFAALLADAAAHRVSGRVLFWNTVRRGPLPHDADWRRKLPPRLSRYLDRSTTHHGRRAVLVGGAAALAAIAWARVSGYQPIVWTGEVLAPWEAQVLAAAVEVLSGLSGLDGLTVAANVDRFLVPMSAGMKGEIHQLMALVEHGTPLGLQRARFTKLSREAREAFLLSLDSRGWLLSQAFRGLRDLVLMGTYQQDKTWPALGYKGPLPPMPAPELVNAPYDTFRAPKGATPKGTVAP